MRKLCISLATVVHVILGANLAIAQYTQTNLVADVKGQAIHTDPVLVNAWGLAFFPHGPFWVADTGTGISNRLWPSRQTPPRRRNDSRCARPAFRSNRFAYGFGC
jgi:hypothetical protein